MHHASRLVLLAGVLVTLGAGSVSAQTAQAPSQRPYRGLFGNGGPVSRQSLDFNASAFGGWSDDVFAQGQRPSPTRPASSGYFYGASFALGYDRVTSWGNVSAGAVSGLRYYPGNDDFVGQTHRADGSVSFKPSSRTDVSVAAVVSYSPRFRFVFLPDEALPPVDPAPGGPPDFIVDVEDDYAVTNQQALSYAASASVSYRVTKRGTLSGSAAYRIVDFTNQDRSDMSYWSARGRYSQQVTRYLGFHAGYGYRPSTYTGFDQERYAGHNIDVGIDYNRSFTLSRSTFFSFSTGSAVLVRERSNLESRSVRYGLLVGAALEHLFGRSWQGTLSYNRGVTYIPGLAEPYFGDSVVAALTGQLSTRLQFTASGGYSHGNPGFSAQERKYDTYYATSGLRYGLTRSLALSGSYFIYSYAFDDGIVLPPGVAQEMNRQGARVSLDLWLPLVR